jgi:hypothetical protein
MLGLLRRLSLELMTSIELLLRDLVKLLMRGGQFIRFRIAIYGFQGFFDAH